MSNVSVNVESESKQSGFCLPESSFCPRSEETEARRRTAEQTETSSHVLEETLTMFSGDEDGRLEKILD